MPIHRTLNFRDLAQPEFDAIDAAVMRHAYATQNKFGRLFDERVYENDLANRLRADGFEVRTQVPVTVTHHAFEKTYFLDLVVNQMLYELKTVAALLGEHRAQALHYAMLHDIRRAKLINFRTAKVQGELQYNSITEAARRQAGFQLSEWQPLTQNCERLIESLRLILADWGTHLSIRLYTEAMVHACGGEAACLQRVDVAGLGTHGVQCHAPGYSFVLTSLNRGLAEHRHHLRCMLNNLDVRAIQWLNLSHSTIECATLRKT